MAQGTRLPPRRRSDFSAEARASDGELVCVSFFLRAFPAASRLCIYFPEGREELSSFDTVVAADRHLLCWWEAHVVVPYGNYLC
ncbi:hypothetical protein U9M48_009166 [Paspalum notatum var. saurae]|uniref:Uncharacterized protein n=1 Tax=Paspalum notatum var. saurae TaxID=547442 RepID=A0AAQ3SQW8_PASNO